MNNNTNTFIKNMNNVGSAVYQDRNIIKQSQASVGLIVIIVILVWINLVLWAVNVDGNHKDIEYNLYIAETILGFLISLLIFSLIITLPEQMKYKVPLCSFFGIFVFLCSTFIAGQADKKTHCN
jgi:hypothetical protein